MVWPQEGASRDTPSVMDPPAYTITGVTLEYLAKVHKAISKVEPGLGDIAMTDIVICGGTGRVLGRFRTDDYGNWHWEGK